MGLEAELRERMDKAGLGKWADELEEWEGGVIADAGNPLPGRWYLTDLRHLHNLGSPVFLGHVTREESEKPEVERIIEDVHYWIEDHFEGEGEDGEV